MLHYWTWSLKYITPKLLHTPIHTTAAHVLVGISLQSDISVITCGCPRWISTCCDAQHWSMVPPKFDKEIHFIWDLKPFTSWVVYYTLCPTAYIVPCNTQNTCRLKTYKKQRPWFSNLQGCDVIPLRVTKTLKLGYYHQLEIYVWSIMFMGITTLWQPSKCRREVRR